MKTHMIKIKPLDDRVIIKRVEKKTTLASGIVLLDSATEKPMEGKVLAIGKGKQLDNGNVRALEVKVGDKVLFPKYSGNEFKIDGEEIIIVHGHEIMCILG